MVMQKLFLFCSLVQILLLHASEDSPVINKRGVNFLVPDIGVAREMSRPSSSNDSLDKELDKQNNSYIQIYDPTKEIRVLIAFRGKVKFELRDGQNPDIVCVYMNRESDQAQVVKKMFHVSRCNSEGLYQVEINGLKRDVMFEPGQQWRFTMNDDSSDFGLQQEKWS